MNYLRKSLVVIASILLPATLFSFGFLVSIGQVFGSPDRLKQALEESNVYEAAVASLVRQASTESPTQDASGVPSSQSAMQEAIAKALPAETIEKQTDQVLDGVYAWLQGDTSTLAFQVDLTEIKSTLSNSLAEQARTQAAQLPVCEPDAPVSTENFDPFNASCLPAGADPNAIADKTRQEVESSELFKDSVLNADDIKQEGGKPLQEQLKPLSDVYDAVREFTIISGVLSVVLAAAIVFFSKPLRSGLRRLNITLLSIGAASAILALIGGAVTKAIVNAIARSSGDGAIQTAGAKAVQFLADDIRTWWLWYGVLLCGAGASMLIGLVIFKNKQPSPPDKPTPPNTSRLRRSP